MGCASSVFMNETDGMGSSSFRTIHHTLPGTLDFTVTLTESDE